MLPLSTPVLATAAIFSFIWTYDDFLGPLIYLNDMRNYTVPLALRAFVDVGRRVALRRSCSPCRRCRSCRSSSSSSPSSASSSAASRSAPSNVELFSQSATEIMTASRGFSFGTIGINHGHIYEQTQSCSTPAAG